jgi:sec-independent protein translocase protein TatA
MFGGLGTTELILILAIVLIIFGAGRLPEVGSAIGKGMRNFRASSRGEDERDVTPESDDTDASEDTDGAKSIPDTQAKSVPAEERSRSSTESA